jgi:hypothetical protein
MGQRLSTVWRLVRFCAQKQMNVKRQRGLVLHPPLKACREQCYSKLKSNLKHIRVHSFIPTGAPILGPRYEPSKTCLGSTGEAPHSKID